MKWKAIEGYRFPYRISDQGIVQKQLPSGEWFTLKGYPYSGQWRVHLWIDKDKWRRVQISKLVADAFMGGTPAGMLRVHKNGMLTDNAVENIIFMTREQAATRHRPGNSRPVVKIDEDGEVVAFYSSQSEAARENYMTQQTISKRCHGLIENPRRLDGYDYIFEENLEKAIRKIRSAKNG